MRKKNILLNWESSRADLMEPFIALKDHFNFSVIWYKEPPDHPQKHPFEEYYFGDFKTPYQLLRKVKPDKIIFFGVHSFPQIALNAAARNKGIYTYTMHHGVFSSNLSAITQMRRDMGIVKSKKRFNSLASFYFYFSALQLSNWKELFKYLFFPFLHHKYGSVEALKKSVFPARLPNKFIQLSPHNAIVYKEMNHLHNDDLFLYIGHPWFDKFLLEIKQEKNIETPEAPYWLLIDFPNIEQNIGFKKVGAEIKTTFYKNLSAFAKADGCKLKVKLHPAGYNSTYNYQDDNMELLKEIDILHQISQAKRCFSFYSTLLIPIIYIKRHCIVFDLGLDIGLQRELIELGVATRLDITGFTYEELIADHSGKKSEEAYKEFITRYLYKTDGEATSRLKEILQSEVN
jgi:hypothetical protein